MREHADVIVVGARCAGSPLAALLARRGIRVVVLERAGFPSDTFSSHLFEADALSFVNRLGALEQLRATGAPLVARTDTRVEDLELAMELPQQPDDVGAIVSVRRLLLDPILAEAAAQAGADVRTGARVTGLLQDDGRIAGVRFEQAGRESEIRARLVVGADGRHSAVARLVGARRYNLTPSQRLLFWAYFEGAECRRRADLPLASLGRAVHPRDPLRQRALPDPDLARTSERERFQADRDGAFVASRARVRADRRTRWWARRKVGKALGAVHWDGFFRQASGAGWVLSGDAGHFKSPAPGRGIGDAFLQAERLATAITRQRSRAPTKRSTGRCKRGGAGATASSPSTTGWHTTLKRPARVPGVLVGDPARPATARQGRPVLRGSQPSRSSLAGPHPGTRARRERAAAGEARHCSPYAPAELGSLGARDMRRRLLNVRPAYAPLTRRARRAPRSAGRAARGSWRRPPRSPAP